MRNYELVMVFHPRLEETEVEAMLEKVNRWIEERGGNLTKTEKWGRRKLAYPINHLQEGNYILTQFQAQPRRMKELETNLRLSEEIIRHLLVKIEE